MIKTAEYEGWANQPTWNVAFLIDNDRRSSEYARQMAKNAISKRNRGKLNLDELTKDFSRVFRRYEREVKKFHDDNAADARDERGKFEREQLEGKPKLTDEQVAALSKEEYVKYISNSFVDTFYDIGGTSGWEKPMEPVDWKEIALNYIDIEDRESKQNQGESVPDPLNEEDKKMMGIKGSKQTKNAEIVKELGTQPLETLGVVNEPAPTLLPNPLADIVQAEEPVVIPVQPEGEVKVITITLAGKKKTLSFSNQKTVNAFVKAASTKFGDKFKVVADEQLPLLNLITLKPGDKITWKTTQFSPDTRSGVVTEVTADNPEGASFEAKMETPVRTDVWGHMGLIFLINNQWVKPLNPERGEFEIVGKTAAVIPSGNEKWLQNAEGFAKDMQKIVTDARRTQADFLQSKGMTMENARKLDESGRKKLQTEYTEWLKTAAITSGMSDIDNGAPTFKGGNDVGKKYKAYTGPTLVNAIAEKLRAAGIDVQVEGTEHVIFTTDKSKDEVLRLFREPNQAETGAVGWSANDIKQATACCTDDYNCDCSNCYPNTPPNGETKKETSMKNAGYNLAPEGVPSQCLVEFYPEIQREVVEYPNVNNSTMSAQMTGDPHVGLGQEDGEQELPDAIEDAFNGMTRIGYVSTSPAGGLIGNTVKPEVDFGGNSGEHVDRNQNDDFYTRDYEGISSTSLHTGADALADRNKGSGFMEGFHAEYNNVAGGALNAGASLKASKTAGANEKTQFADFLKRVMGEVVATFLAAFKVSYRRPLNKVPGTGEIHLDLVEQSITSAVNVVNQGSLVKHLIEKMTDSELQDCINTAFSQGAIWCDAEDGGFVFEAFARAESLDSDSLVLKYRFVVGTKEAEDSVEEVK